MNLVSELEHDHAMTTITLSNWRFISRVPGFCASRLLESLPAENVF